MSKKKVVILAGTTCPWEVHPKGETWLDKGTHELPADYADSLIRNGMAMTTADHAKHLKELDRVEKINAKSTEEYRKAKAKEEAARQKSMARSTEKPKSGKTQYDDTKAG